jgi:hypothetical protein
MLRVVRLQGGASRWAAVKGFDVRSPAIYESRRAAEH